MEQVDFFHFEMEIELESGEGTNRLELPFNFIGDFQSPDRTQATLEISIPSSSNTSKSIASDVIIIGDTAYATNPVTGEWQFSPDALLPVKGPYQIISIDPSDIGGGRRGLNCRSISLATFKAPTAHRRLLR